MAATMSSMRLGVQTSFKSIATQRRTSRVGALVSKRQPVVVRASAEDTDVGAAGVAIAATGLIANPVVFWSLYTLKTTGAGLQGDVLGGIEGVSYLVVLGIFGWSLKTKLSTGSGLPAGPSGLLGAAEGLSFLSVVAAAIIFGLKAANL